MLFGLVCCTSAPPMRAKFVRLSMRRTRLVMPVAFMFTVISACWANSAPFKPRLANVGYSS